MKFKALDVTLLVHKCIYGVTPKYLLDLIKIKEGSRYQLRSHRGILLMDNTYRTKTTLGDRAFENVAPKYYHSPNLKTETVFSLANGKTFYREQRTDSNIPPAYIDTSKYFILVSRIFCVDTNKPTQAFFYVYKQNFFGFVSCITKTGPGRSKGGYHSPLD